ncbi:MAG: RDD family protein [Calditrichota bacterium]
MKCSKCGTWNDGDRKFCEWCGNPLVPLQSKAGGPELIPQLRDRYAGIIRRLIAFAIDAVIVLLVGRMLTTLLYLGDPVTDPTIEQTPVTQILSWFRFEFTFLFIKISWSAGIFWWLYYALFESSVLQATPGKLICRAIVADLKGNRISFWRASNRFFSKIVTGLTFGIGFIILPFMPNKQTLHDLLSGCVVLR